LLCTSSTTECAALGQFGRRAMEQQGCSASLEAAAVPEGAEKSAGSPAKAMRVDSLDKAAVEQQQGCSVNSTLPEKPAGRPVKAMRVRAPLPRPSHPPGSLRRRPRRKLLPEMQADALRLEPLATDSAITDGPLSTATARCEERTCAFNCIARQLEDGMAAAGGSIGVGGVRENSGAGSDSGCVESGTTASASESGVGGDWGPGGEPAVLVRRRASLLRVRTAAAGGGGARGRMTVRLPHVVPMRSRGSFAQGRIAKVRYSSEGMNMADGIVRTAMRDVDESNLPADACVSGPTAAMDT
jgi:hypothetical protein